MSKQLLICLLSEEFYRDYSRYIQEEMFPRELQPLYITLKEAHDKYQQDITLDELADIYFMKHPTLSESNKSSISVLINILKQEPKYNPTVAQDVIESSFQANSIRKIMSLLVDGEARGKVDWESIHELESSIASLPSVKYAAPTYDVVDLLSIDDLMNNSPSEGSWQYNIPELQSKTRGLFKSSFTIVGARPEAGKSAFAISISCAPGGFIHQGANVHVWRNEEQYQAMAMRTLCAITQLPQESGNLVKMKFINIRDTIEGNISILKDTVTLQKGIEDIEDYLVHNPTVDIFIIDQIDNLRINGMVARNDVRLLEELYARIREVAIKFDIAIIALTQAGADADNKLYWGYTELYSSKTGKAATGDVILCIGFQKPSQGQEDTGFRVINYAKNKFGGSQVCTACTLTHKLSTYN